MATAKAAKGTMMEYDVELVHPFWIFWDPVIPYRGPDALQRWYPSGVGGCREFHGWPLHLPVEGAESAWNFLVNDVNSMTGIVGWEMM